MISLTAGSRDAVGGPMSRSALAQAAVAKMNGGSSNEGGSSSSFHSATPGLDVELTTISGPSRQYASNGPSAGVVLSPSQLDAF